MSFSEYNNQLDAFTLYHIVQQEEGKGASYDGGPLLPALGHALAGGVASALAKSAVYPIDTIVTRMQVQNHLKGEREAPSAASDADAEYGSPLDAARKIYKNEGGLAAFYTGVGPDVVKGLSDSFLFFLAYAALRQGFLKRQESKSLPVLKELSVGVLAGAFSKAITSPIQNIVTRQQTAALIAARDPASSSSSGDRSKASVRDIAKQIHSEKGLSGFWAGYSAQLILTLNPAITFAVDNVLRSLVPKKQRETRSAQVTFLVAALSKVVATALTYPVMLAKARAQASQGYEWIGESHKYTPYPDNKTKVKETLRRVLRIFEGQVALYYSLRKIYRTEGVKGLYSGIEGEVVKGFLQHGLTMSLKDNVMGGIIQLYYVLLKLTKRWEGELEKVQRNAGVVAKGVVESAKEGAKDVQQRAENIGTSLVEEAKHLGSKATGEEN
ncbi:related to peroxisomal ATP carrier [Ramularia collo-cygni]|uniref:Related to peroxisomal ATP carrier n=1 Tax=Ramularia collo-cygni TaxID=112498 RepID=A0A2D3VRP6_9PEZI|nr:related to peroxisomal ATP carrier [Ramularia collo-cygni]CZT25088.1 related to peroxisomal ATP carrier [Ramularia collo-cygni]